MLRALRQAGRRRRTAAALFLKRRCFYSAANAIAAIPGAGAGALCVKLLAAYALPHLDMLFMLAEHLPLLSLLNACSATSRALRRVLGLHSGCDTSVTCATAGWVSPGCRVGQLMLRPDGEGSLPVDAYNVAALRAAGFNALRAARLVSATNLSGEAVLRASALRGLIVRAPGDRFAKAATFNISVPSVLRFFSWLLVVLAPRAAKICTNTKLFWVCKQARLQQLST